ncbi:MAG: small ribosomal subunit Rsm22 family protein [Nitrospiraceae bacterium]
MVFSGVNEAMSPQRLVSPEVLASIAEISNYQIVEPEVIASWVRDLWRLFTKDRQRLERNYLENAQLRAEYLRYYLPVNAAKIHSVLKELPPSDDIPERKSYRVLDVGAGPGSGSLAVREWARASGCAETAINAVAIDRSRQALTLAQTLWSSVAQKQVDLASTFQSDVVNLESASEVRRFLGTQSAGFDLVIIANALNESFVGDRDPVGRRVKVVGQLLDALSPSGSLVILEPALREPTRELHALRDQLIAKGLCHVYSPCLHERPCPAMVHAEDWCHEERPWDPPDDIVAMDRQLGFIKDALKFSYVVLRKDGATIVPRAPELARIVSERRPSKGQLRL